MIWYIGGYHALLVRGGGSKFLEGASVIGLNEKCYLMPNHR